MISKYRKIFLTTFIISLCFKHDFHSVLLFLHIPLHVQHIAYFPFLYNIYKLNAHLSVSNRGHQSMCCIDCRGESKKKYLEENMNPVHPVVGTENQHMG